MHETEPSTDLHGHFNQWLWNVFQSFSFRESRVGKTFSYLFLSDRNWTLEIIQPLKPLQERITRSLHLPYKPLKSTLSDEKLFILHKELGFIVRYVYSLQSKQRKFQDDQRTKFD